MDKKRKNKLLCALLLINILVVTVLIGSIFFLRPTCVTISCDSKIAKNFKIKLEKEIRDFLLKKRTSAKKLFSFLQGQIPSIEKISLNRRRPRHVHVRIMVQKPWVKVKQLPSNEMILSRSGICSPGKIYAKRMQKHIPYVIVQEKAFSPSSNDDPSRLSLRETSGRAACSEFPGKSKIELYQWLRRLPESVLHDYLMDWKKNTEITLKNKKNPNVLVVTTAKKTFDKAMEEKIRRVTKKIPKKLEKKKWKVDTRFKDQIVLSRVK